VPDTQDRFARSGAIRDSEFGKVIGLMETFDRFTQMAAMNEIVPFGNEIVDGANRWPFR